MGRVEQRKDSPEPVPCIRAYEVADQLVPAVELQDLVYRCISGNRNP